LLKPAFLFCSLHRISGLMEPLAFVSVNCKSSMTEKHRIRLRRAYHSKPSTSVRVVALLSHSNSHWVVIRTLSILFVFLSLVSFHLLAFFDVPKSQRNQCTRVVRGVAILRASFLLHPPFRCTTFGQH
jgi:hypothetical protein